MSIITFLIKPDDSFRSLFLELILYFFHLIREYIKNFSKSGFIVVSWFGGSYKFNPLNLQTPATETMEGIYNFNLHLFFIITNIVLIVSWLLLVILKNFLESDNRTPFEFSHNSTIEIIWTTMPALVLCSLASPSFSLLYSLDETAAPELSIKILGHQWYWSYEISDYNLCLKTKTLKFSSYMISEESLKSSGLGLFRNLETNKRLVVPSNTHLRFLVTSVDVLHSWTIPSFGIKVDACPGRLNQSNLFIKRLGVFFGQCSEICGVNHGFMPISVLSLPSQQFYSLITSNLKLL